MAVVGRPRRSTLRRCSGCTRNAPSTGMDSTVVGASGMVKGRGSGCGRPTRGVHSLCDWPVFSLLADAVQGGGRVCPEERTPCPSGDGFLDRGFGNGKPWADRLPRRRGWKVPDGCARRSSTPVADEFQSAPADVPHRRRLCDSPELLRGCGGDARKSRCGAVSTTRSARPSQGMGAGTRDRRS